MKRALLFFSGLGMGFVGIDLFMQMPGAAPILDFLVRLMVPFWMLLGFGLVHFVYRLLGRRNDAAYYAVFIFSLIAVAVTVTTDLAIRGHAVYAHGPMDVRNPFWHTIVCIPDVAGGIWAAILVIRALRGKLTPRARQIYRLILTGGVIVLLSITFFNIVLPNVLGAAHLPRPGASMFAWFSVLVMIAVRQHRFLELDVETAADALFEDMNDAVVLLDRAGRVRRMNRAARELLIPHGAALGVELSAVVPPLVHRLVFSHDGEERTLAVSRFLRKKGDFVLGETLVLRDETEQQRARAVLRQSRDELEKSARSRTRRLRQAQRMEALATLSAGIAADFNRIISEGIGHMAAACRLLPPAHPVQEDLNDALKVAMSARALVKQMLSFSEGGERRMQAVDAARLVKDVLKVMQLSIPSSVSVQTAASGRCMVMGDPMRLHRALLNVLTNSIQSMEKGAGRLLISVQSVNLSGDRSMTTGVLRPGTWVSIAVEDTGAGMSSSVLDRIFEPFFTTKKEGEGTGIGLTGTLRIIDEHRGVIDVSSSPGQGTRFHIYLPAARENPDDVTEPEEGVPCCG